MNLAFEDQTQLAKMLNHLNHFAVVIITHIINAERAKAELENEGEDFDEVEVLGLDKRQILDQQIPNC